MTEQNKDEIVVVLELDHQFAEFLLGRVGQSAEDLSGLGIAHQLVMSDFLELDEFPLAALALGSLADLCLGRPAHRSTDLLHRHSDRHGTK